MPLPSTGPLGLAQAATGVTICAPAASARSMKAAIGSRVPFIASYAALPRNGPPLPNASHGVGTGENVFVSCCIWAMTIFMSSPTTSSHRQGREGRKGPQRKSCPTIL